ncbi:phage baseplate assembly protein V [Hydrogenophaga sp.]|uniref:phage baseplate assembly protein V n=1 Tax=Hydrogenophaga sp. TaxID=1904254 RepID=UPI003F712CE5
MSQTPSPATPVELLRRLENLLRPGTIHAVNHATARVRVASGGLVTDWLPWFERRAGNVRTWSPPSVGEQCLVLSPGGDPANGFVLVGVASDAHPSPSASPHVDRTQYPDGTTIDYDHAAHVLRVDAPLVQITGEAIIQGPVTVATDVIAAGISLVHHVHGGIVPGGSNTSTPV